MSHYSNNPGSTRIDLFRDTGKWYATGSINLDALYNEDVFDAVKQACQSAWEDQVLPGVRLSAWPLSTSPTEWLASGGTIVCLDPYNKHSHPIMLKA